MNKNWILPAVIAIIISAVQDVCMKNMLNKINDPVSFSAEILVYTGIISFLYLLITNWNSKKKNQIGNSINYKFMLAIIGFLISLFLAKSFKLSPNPGFTRAIYGLNAVAGIIASYFAFGTPLTIKTLGLTSLVTSSVMIFLYNI